MGIIVEGEIIKRHNTKELKYFDRGSLYILTNNVSTLLVTQVAVFEIAASISIGQTSQRCEIFLLIFLSVRAYVKSPTDVRLLSIPKETESIGSSLQMINL